MVLVAAVFTLYFTHKLIAAGPLLLALQALAALFMLWARITFGWRSFHAAASPTEGGLVTSGPYALVRHPIYAAILLFLGAGITAHLAWQTVALGLLALAATVVRMVTEERLVRARYPEYAAYAARTRRLIPHIL